MKVYKLLSYGFTYIAPVLVGYFVFYQDQEVKVKLSLAGMIGLILVFLTYYKKFKDYQKRQEQAHETARNLGQASETVNFIALGLLNFTFTSIPFFIVLLVERVLLNYSGNAVMGIGFLLASFFVGEFFNILYRTSEQVKIREKLVAKEKAHIEELTQQIKDRT